MVPWHGRSREEVRGKILREQNNATIIQCRNTMLWRPPIQRRRNGICWRIVSKFAHKLFQTVYLSRIGRPDFLWSVTKLARAVSGLWFCRRPKLGSQTFVPITWTDICLIHGLRTDGTPRWDFLNQLKKSTGRVQGNLLRDTPSNKHTHNQTKTRIQHDDLELSNVDDVSSNAMSSHSRDVLKIMKRWSRY